MTLALCWVGFVAVSGLSAQEVRAGGSSDEERLGDIFVADRFVLWAERALDEGRRTDARSALVRAGDFADVSSDVSFLLARTMRAGDENRFLVLQVLEKAIMVNQWLRYAEPEARLFQTELLIELRRFDSALNSLAAHRDLVGDTTESLLLQARALRGLAWAGAVWADSVPSFVTIPETVEFPSDAEERSFAGEFRRLLLDIMEWNPHDPRPLRLFLEYVLKIVPTPEDLILIETVVQRVPFLLDADPELAWMAASYVGDLEAARRLVLGYRAGSFGGNRDFPFRPNPTSLIQALNLGLVDDMQAVEELFRSGTATFLDRSVLLAVDRLLHGDEGRNLFAERLHGFSGTITVDEDGDGIPESRLVFSEGLLQSFSHDALQSGTFRMHVVFDSGLPVLAELALPEGQAVVVWERYPLVRQVRVEGETFVFPLGEFRYLPIRFANVGASLDYEGMLLPDTDPLSPALNLRMLGLAASVIERQSSEFPTGTERTVLQQGIPVLAEVFENGLLISVTEFENGFPVVQRLDLSRNGKLETVRRFHPGTWTPTDLPASPAETQKD